MLLSHLIDRLQLIKETHGDIPAETAVYKTPIGSVKVVTTYTHHPDVNGKDYTPRAGPPFTSTTHVELE